MTVVLRNIDIEATPDDTASTDTPGVEAYYTTSGSGALSVVAGVGWRLSVAAASGDDVLVQTPEKQEGGEWVRSIVTGFFNETRAGRDVEIGFIDGANDEGVFFRIDDGVIKLVRRYGSGPSEATQTISGITLSQVHRWEVKLTGRHRADFYIDGVSMGSVESAAEPLTTIPKMRAGVRVTNPGVTSGTGSFDIHRWTVEADARARHRALRIGAAAKTAAVKGAGDEGGHLFKACCNSTSPGAVRYLMTFDKATAPVDTDVPVSQHQIHDAIGQARSVCIDFNEDGVRYAYGMWLAISTTIGVLTLPATNEAYFEAMYT
jgi:hypothetical protein